MVTVQFVVSIGLALAVAHGPRAEESASRQWQDRIDHEECFEFSDEEASVLSSIKAYCARDSQIHVIYDPAKKGQWRFAFVHNGKPIVTLYGHEFSVFRTDAEDPDDPFPEHKQGHTNTTNTLYFAHFSPDDFGCTVTAHDLSTGKLLWKTPLKALGPIEHSIYDNLINMQVYGDVLWIKGRESAGNYVEIVDRKTGRTIAHRKFKTAETESGPRTRPAKPTH